MKLTKAQRRVLAVVHEVGGIHRYVQSMDWHRKYPQGYVSRVCGNSTIEAPKRKGFLCDAGFLNVTLTPAGRAALEKGQADER